MSTRLFGNAFSDQSMYYFAFISSKSSDRIVLDLENKIHEIDDEKKQAQQLIWSFFHFFFILNIFVPALKQYKHSLKFYKTCMLCKNMSTIDQHLFEIQFFLLELYNFSDILREIEIRKKFLGSIELRRSDLCVLCCVMC